MSNYFDLTEDISSDDSISVDGRPDPKRWRMSAASSTGAAAAAVSRHSMTVAVRGGMMMINGN
jgi:hypothetical protein